VVLFESFGAACHQALKAHDLYLAKSWHGSILRGCNTKSGLQQQDGQGYSGIDR
jgi:hypothetical protein